MSAADDRYNHSGKGRARNARYNHSSKGRARWRRYYERRQNDPTPTGTYVFKNWTGELVTETRTAGEDFRWRENVRKTRAARCARIAANEQLLLVLGAELDEICQRNGMPPMAERILGVGYDRNRRAAADRRYDQSEKGKARYARYQASLKGMMRWNRYDRKRALARGAAQLAERGLLASEEELLANGYHSEGSFWVRVVED